MTNKYRRLLDILNVEDDEARMKELKEYIAWVNAAEKIVATVIKRTERPQNCNLN